MRLTRPQQRALDYLSNPAMLDSHGALRSGSGLGVRYVTARFLVDAGLACWDEKPRQHHEATSGRPVWEWSIRKL